MNLYLAGVLKIVTGFRGFRILRNHHLWKQYVRENSLLGRFTNFIFSNIEANPLRLVEASVKAVARSFSAKNGAVLFGFGGTCLADTLGGGFKHFLFLLLFGEDSHFDSYVSKGLVQPPTSTALFQCLD